MVPKKALLNRIWFQKRNQAGPGRQDRRKRERQTQRSVYTDVIVIPIQIIQIQSGSVAWVLSGTGIWPRVLERLQAKSCKRV